MASTTFVDNSSIIYASWLNDINATTYNGTFISSTITPSNLVCNGSVSGTGFTGLVNNTLSAPGQIGNGTPNTGAFTTLSATTPVAVSSGGTGLSTLIANNVILGNGTSAPSFVAPSTTGNVLTSNGTTWISSVPVTGGMTLLGTITTTSGTSQSLTGLTLTGYKQIQCQLNGASISSSGSIQINAKAIMSATTSNVYGIVLIDLTTGYFSANTGDLGGTGTSATFVNNSGLTTASTSITFTASAGTFDNGSILVYGVR